jgi:hypothetical protein
MDFTYRIDTANRIVYLEGETVDFDLWKRTMLTILADPDYDTNFNFFSDRRFSEQVRSPGFIRSALHFLKSHAKEMGTCKWATVVSKAAAYGMGRMSQFLSEGSNITIEVFTDIDEARRWLLEDLDQIKAKREARKPREEDRP